MSIIQNAEQVNQAIFSSGALRANQLLQHIPNPSASATYLPLSSVELAGLVSEQTEEFLLTTEVAKKLGLFFDHYRVNKLALTVGLAPSNSTDKERLIFSACFQEACNQTNEQHHDLCRLRANVMNLMECLEFQDAMPIQELLQSFASQAFAVLPIGSIRFEAGQLSNDSVQTIKKTIETLQATGEAGMIEVAEHALTEEATFPVFTINTVNAAERIHDLDRLISCLSVDSHRYSSDALREHQAQFFLLRYQYCVLYQTERKGWTPYFHQDTPDRIPAAIANHLQVIKRAHDKEISYVQALANVKEISCQAQRSWFETLCTWVVGEHSTVSHYHQYLSNIEAQIFDENDGDDDNDDTVVIHVHYSEEKNCSAQNSSSTVLDDAITHLRKI